MINLINGDCLEAMAKIPDGSVDLILTDPPYGTVKGLEKSGAFVPGRGDSHEWDETIDTAEMMNQCNRVLRRNGVLVLFSQDPYTYKLASEFNKNLPFAYRCTWLKNTFGNPLLAKVSPVNYTEDILFFFKKNPKYDYELLHPLRDYARTFCSHIGRSVATVATEIGHGGLDHFFRFASSQFKLPTSTTYETATRLYGLDQHDWFIDYDILKIIDDAFSNELNNRMNNDNPKIFNLAADKGHKSNVYEYAKESKSYHPTQKPVALLSDIIETYSREGDTVLDFTMGGGSTGVAAVAKGRRFVGVERCPVFFGRAESRIAGTA